MVEVIKYKPNQTADGVWGFPEDLYNVWHIIGPMCDYTACGHATDEYPHEKKQGKVTCPSCLKTIEFYKKLKVYKYLIYEG
jgi:hypothetical protein